MIKGGLLDKEQESTLGAVYYAYSGHPGIGLGTDPVPFLGGPVYG